MITNEINITLSSAVEKNPELKRAVVTEPQTKQLMEYATALEGLSRSAGVHAAGVVISDRDLSEYVPLCRDVKGNDIVSQYSMNPLNDLGLLKMDFLGLKTLTVIEDTVTLIRKNVSGFSLKNIPLDDAAAFGLYNRGETIGLFQMESGGITSVSKQFDVRKLDDIIALIALYRPGPMELIGDYIKRKKGLTKIRYEHPLLEEICADTYGVMIYQEQVMAAASKLAGYSMGQADLLRRAMGKKDKEKMAKERANFIAGCARTNEIGEKKANAIFDLLEKFAGYGFNKSHSAAATSSRWKIFAAGSIPVSPIAKCWNLWSNVARLIFCIANEQNFSPVSTMRWPRRPRRIAIGWRDRSHFSGTRMNMLRPRESDPSLHGAIARK